MKSAELFLVASDVFGGDFECGSQGGEACGSGGSGPVAVLGGAAAGLSARTGTGSGAVTRPGA